MCVLVTIKSLETAINTIDNVVVYIGTGIGIIGDARVVCMYVCIVRCHCVCVYCVCQCIV